MSNDKIICETFVPSNVFINRIEECSRCGRPKAHHPVKDTSPCNDGCDVAGCENSGAHVVE